MSRLGPGLPRAALGCSGLPVAARGAPGYVSTEALLSTPALVATAPTLMNTRRFLRSVAVLGGSTLVAVVALPAPLAAQGGSGMQQAGPVIESAGPTFAVEDPTFTMPADHEYRVVWEMVDGADEPTDVDPGYVTLARFLNLHARHGVDPDRIHLAAVVHGSGWHALLNDEAYGARFDDLENPSRTLIEELLANGVEIVLCGQTAGARGVDRAELLPGVEMGLSAMTALHWFQSRGYTLNPW